MAEHPQKLGKYEIRRELGRGAMGVVFDAWDPSIERRVALKTVRRDQLEGGEAQEMLDRFKREAQAAGRLSHPNIVSVYEYGEDEGTAYIAMEYVEGRELKDYFDKNECFALPQVGRLMSELLDALGQAHTNGIVHRDIKPANLFILKDGRLKVGDFGIARIESSNLTQAGSVLGTPAYMSPEQFMGQTIDGRSDLFSAGVILYQFLTGEKPFTGQLTTIMHKVLKEDPIAPSELNVQVPPAFDPVVKKALAKRPNDRFQTAKEFSAALLAAIAGVPANDPDATMNASADPDATVLGGPDLAAKPVADGAAKTAAATPSVSATPASIPPPAAKQSSALAFVIVGGLVVVGLGAGAYLMNRPAPEQAISNAAMPAAPSSTPVSPSAATPAVVPVPVATARQNELVISAVGYADPSDPRYANDPGLLKSELREDAKRQLIEKAVGLYVQSGSMIKNYDILRSKLLSRSGDFIDAVIKEDPPQTGKDGLVSVTTRATVRVREVQKSLNQMSRDERIEFIRNNGDPKISVSIASKPEEGQAQRSPVAENLLKERIQSFGFRTWSEETTQKGADFSVIGEAKFKKLSARLAASGITIEKTVLTSWTVKCIDKQSGEEIYFNTQIPEKQSWASEEQALSDIGKLIGEEFSKNFFLQHFRFAGQKVRMNLTGLPGKDAATQLLHEITGLRSVLDVKPAGEATFDLELAGGTGSLADLVAATVVQPINRKLGRTCLSIGGISGAEINVALDASCTDATVLGKLDSLPAASLYEAPPARRNAVIKNPETLKKFLM
jgi:serine/threonine-protein kinase